MFTRLLAILFGLFFPGGGDDPEPDTEPAPGNEADGAEGEEHPDYAGDDPDDEPSGAGGDDNDLSNLSDNDLRDLARKLIKTNQNIRRENQRRRVEAEGASALQERLDKLQGALTTAFGLEEDDEDPDPAALSQSIESQSAEIRKLKTQNKFLTLAPEAGANARLTWAYLVSEGQIDDLDPEAEDFAKTLQARVEAAIKAEPSLSAKPAPPPKGGADLNDDGNPDAKRPEEMTMDEYVEWRAERDKKED